MTTQINTTPATRVPLDPLSHRSTSKTTRTNVEQTQPRRYDEQTDYRTVRPDWIYPHINGTSATSVAPGRQYSRQGVCLENRPLSSSGQPMTRPQTDTHLASAHRANTTSKRSHPARPQLKPTSRKATYLWMEPQYPLYPPSSSIRDHQTAFLLDSTRTKTGSIPDNCKKLKSTESLT